MDVEGSGRKSSSAIHTSLMRRAAQTAEIIAPAIGDGTLKPVADCGFCEQHHGEGDGLAWDDPITQSREDMTMLPSQMAALLAREPDQAPDQR